MTRLLALLRSAYLAFLVGYILVVAPLDLFWSGAPTSAAAPVPARVVEKLFTVAWLAILWIGLETVLAWIRVWLEVRARRRVPGPVVLPPP